MVKPISWWALAAALAAPVLLIGGFLLAAAIQPASYNPVRDTISELAGQGATHSWLMTSALVGLGSCYVIAALGLEPARGAGRVMLAGGGAATLSIAAFRQPVHGYSDSHEVAVILTALTCCTWPAFAWQRRHPAPLLRPVPGLTAAAASLGLAAWYSAESHGPLLGLAERFAASIPPFWLLAVVVTTRHAQPPATSSLDLRPGRV